MHRCITKFCPVIRQLKSHFLPTIYATQKQESLKSTDNTKEGTAGLRGRLPRSNKLLKRMVPKFTYMNRTISDGNETQGKAIPKTYCTK